MRTLVEGPDYRGTGRTTKQMRDAPEGAVYIWPVSGSLDYAKSLAQKLGRDDLEIVGPSVLSNGLLLGRLLKGIVLDHACDPDEREWENFEKACALVGRS